MNEILADLAIDTILWFELVDDDVLHPDTAVKILEGWSARLNELGASDRLWFCDRLRARAAVARDTQARLALDALREYLLDG